MKYSDLHPALQCDTETQNTASLHELREKNHRSYEMIAWRTDLFTINVKQNFEN